MRGIGLSLPTGEERFCTGARERAARWDCSDSALIRDLLSTRLQREKYSSLRTYRKFGILRIQNIIFSDIAKKSNLAGLL